MQVLLTVALLLAAVAWVVTVQRRLARLRDGVKAAWKHLEADQSNDSVKAVYNRHVSVYNAALESFPANVFGPMAGFKPARPFD